MQNKMKAHAVISGKVQGVFFRMETKREADKNGVRGWVRNRSDGAVEAVFEGDEGAVKAMIEWCKAGPPRSRVTGVDATWAPYADEFSEFEIRY